MSSSPPLRSGARPAGAQPALHLFRESFGERVELVAFRGSGPASDSGREEFARLAISRASGSHLVVAPLGPSALPGSELPAAIAPLLGGGSIALDWRGRCWRVAAPRGRGRVILLPSLDAAREAAHVLRDGDERRGFERAVDAALAGASPGAGARGPLADLGEGEAEGLDAPPLEPANAARAGEFDHALELGGERCLEAHPSGLLLPALLVRGRESFALPLRRGGAALGRRQLVLLRCTAPADRGARLRVELDDEDLGPWRLGEGAADGWSLDRFRIASDLLAGRELARLAFTPADGREVASIRWRFLVEDEFDGSWLSDLDGEPSGGRPPARDRDARGGLLRLGGRDHLRGFELEAGSALVFRIAQGYRRLVLLAGAERPAEGACAAEPVRLAIERDGSAVAELAWPPGARPARAEVALAGACSIRLAVGGARGASLVIVDPRLLR